MNNEQELKTTWVDGKTTVSRVSNSDKNSGVARIAVPPDINREEVNGRSSVAILNIFGFEGRIGRLIFFYFFLFGIIVNVMLRIWDPSLSSGLELIVFLIIGVGGMWIITCAVVKRFHDLGESGWNYWRLLIPIYNIYLLWLLLSKKGTDGWNTYGEDPLAPIDISNDSPGVHAETTVPKREHSDIKYCRHCGGKHVKDAKFCVSCGSSFHGGI